MLRILVGVSVLLTLTTGWFYVESVRQDRKIDQLQQTVNQQEAELAFRQTVAQIKNDIDGVLKEYRKISKENKEELSKQQQYLTTLGEQVRDDVSDYASNPITSSNVIDISWVYAYNRSAVRIPYAQ